ncbi:MAG TPA: hypothetical protein VFU38_05105 [Candidatus Krumholzibacteria bacterium]|nr:hypothetical protein [Candidatus Krumholzibacteria bacterium]
MHVRAVLIGVGFVMVCATAPRADEALGVQVGAGYLPMKDWEDFWDGVTEGAYQHDRLGLYTEVSLTSRLTQRHAIRFTFEWITTSAWAAVNQGEVDAHSIEWDFETFPVSASYELTLRGAEPGALTLLGVGAGYYMSEVTGKTVGRINPVTETRRGDGYGFHAYLRQTALIADHFSLSGMIRGRWADGMALDDNDGDVKVEFTGVDVSMGIEYRI